MVKSKIPAVITAVLSFLVTALSIGVSYYCFELVSGYCPYYAEVEQFGIPIFYFGLFSFLTTVVVLFRPVEALGRWLRFALWYIPLGVLCASFLIANDLTGGPLPDFSPAMKTFFFAVPFLIISLIIAFKKQRA